MTGRKRHIVVDTMGLLMRVCVHPANIQERDGAKLLLQSAAPTSWQLMWADSGYRGEPFAQWVQDNCGCRLEVVKKDPQQQGFKALRFCPNAGLWRKLLHGLGNADA